MMQLTAQRSQQQPPQKPQKPQSQVATVDNGSQIAALIEQVKEPRETQHSDIANPNAKI